MTQDSKNGIFRVLPVVLSICFGLTTTVSTTLAILKGMDSARQQVQIAQILTIIDNMREVDAQLALQMERDKGERTTEIAVIQAQISNIGKLLEEIKSAVLGVKR